MQGMASARALRATPSGARGAWSRVERSRVERVVREAGSASRAERIVRKTASLRYISSNRGDSNVGVGPPT